MLSTPVVAISQLVTTALGTKLAERPASKLGIPSHWSDALVGCVALIAFAPLYGALNRKKASSTDE